MEFILLALAVAVLGTVLWGLILARERCRNLTELMYLAGSGWLLLYTVRGSVSVPVSRLVRSLPIVLLAAIPAACSQTGGSTTKPSKPTLAMHIVPWVEANAQRYVDQAVEGLIAWAGLTDTAIVSPSGCRAVAMTTRRRQVAGIDKGSPASR